MKSGNYDGVSASGDATNRLIAGGSRAGQHRPDPELREHLRGPQEQAPQHGRRRQATASRTAAAPNLLMCRTDGRHDRARQLGASSSTAASPYKGKVTRLRLADLHRRRGGLPDGDQARPRHQEPVRSSTRPSSTAAVDLLKQQKRRWSRKYWGTYSDQIALRRRRRRPSGRPGSSRSTCSGPTKVPVEAILPNEGATGWSDTWMISSKRQAPELHVQVDGLHDLGRGATARRRSGSARRRPARRPATDAEKLSAGPLRADARRRTRRSSARSGTGRRRRPTAATTDAATTARTTTTGSRPGPRSGAPDRRLTGDPIARPPSAARRPRPSQRLAPRAPSVVRRSRPATTTPATASRRAGPGLARRLAAWLYRDRRLQLGAPAGRRRSAGSSSPTSARSSSCS